MGRNSRKARAREAQRQRRENHEHLAQLEAARQTAARQELAANLHLLQALIRLEQEREAPQKNGWLSFRLGALLTFLAIAVLVLTLTRQLTPTLEELFGIEVK